MYTAHRQASSSQRRRTPCVSHCSQTLHTPEESRAPTSRGIVGSDVTTVFALFATCRTRRDANAYARAVRPARTAAEPVRDHDVEPLRAARRRFRGPRSGRTRGQVPIQRQRCRVAARRTRSARRAASHRSWRCSRRARSRERRIEAGCVVVRVRVHGVASSHDSPLRSFNKGYMTACTCAEWRHTRASQRGSMALEMP